MKVLSMDLIDIINSNSLLPSTPSSARRKRLRNMPAASKPNAMQKSNLHDLRPRTDPPQSLALSAPHPPANANLHHQTLSDSGPSHGALSLVLIWRYLGKGAKAHGAQRGRSPRRAQLRQDTRRAACLVIPKRYSRRYKRQCSAPKEIVYC